MEYTIDQIPNAILDALKDYKDRPKSIIWVYREIQKLCPSVDFVSSNYNFNTFLKTCREINSIYKFVYQIEIGGRLHLIYTTQPYNIENLRKTYVYDNDYYGFSSEVEVLNRTNGATYTRDLAAASLEEYSNVCATLVSTEAELALLRKERITLNSKISESEKLVSNLYNQVRNKSSDIDKLSYDLKNRMDKDTEQNGSSRVNQFTQAITHAFYGFVIGVSTYWYFTM
jgi:uncharacterized protein YdiU (UPF0061 family)